MNSQMINTLKQESLALSRGASQYRLAKEELELEESAKLTSIIRKTPMFLIRL